MPQAGCTTGSVLSSWVGACLLADSRLVDPSHPVGPVHQGEWDGRCRHVRVQPAVGLPVAVVPMPDPDATAALLIRIDLQVIMIDLLTEEFYHSVDRQGASAPLYRTCVPPPRSRARSPCNPLAFFQAARPALDGLVFLVGPPEVCHLLCIEDTSPNQKTRLNRTLECLLAPESWSHTFLESLFHYLIPLPNRTPRMIYRWAKTNKMISGRTTSIVYATISAMSG